MEKKQIYKTGLNGSRLTEVKSAASAYQNVQTTIVIGLPRSGTTLLAYMLAGGDSVLSLSEPFLSRAVCRHRLLNWLYFPKIRKSRISPPRNSDEIGFLTYLKNFSKNIGFSSLIIKETYRQKPCLENTELIKRLVSNGEQVVAITRHPYDTSISTIRLFRQLRGVKGKLMRIIISGLPVISDDRVVVEWFANNWLSFAYWCKQNQPFVVRYEDLVRNPEPHLQEICRRYDIPFNRKMLNNTHPRFYSGMSGDPGGLKRHKEKLFIRPIGKVNQLKPEFTDIIKSTCGQAAEELGYLL
jgi:hypothetical protein